MSDNEDYVTNLFGSGRAGAVRPVVLAGPTASGKSELALQIAERDRGCVINADASQVYACWRVLTARPGSRDLARAPHALYGHVSCGTRHSVGSWLRDLVPALEDARRAGLRPVIVGGTGLYLSALTEGLADIPEISPDVRARSREMLRDGRVEVMRAELERQDPVTHARIDPSNPMRVQRAWEVLVATGRGLADWHREDRRPVLPATAAVCRVVQIDNDIRNNKIERRFQDMLEGGALEECRAFLAARYDPELPAGQVLGAEPLMACLRGDLDLNAAAEAAVTATRRFAKRQRTWFRSRMAVWPRIDPQDALASIPNR
jgi:tRNA dimethylallyltransferase